MKQYYSQKFYDSDSYAILPLEIYRIDYDDEGRPTPLNDPFETPSYIINIEEFAN